MARRALDLGAGLNKGSCGVVFFGGEPLLEKELIRRVVADAKARMLAGEGSFHFKITTNGLLLDEDFLRFAVADNVQITMSFDGVRAAHDAHRRAPDGSPTFDLLLERLKMLLRFKPYAGVIMVVNPDTVQHMADGVSMLLDLGVRYVVLALNYAAAWQEANWQTLDAQYRRLGRLYVRWTQAGRKFYFSPFEVKISSHVHQDCADREQCDLGARQISVDPQGYLYPCVQFPKAGPESSWCIGNVFEGLDEPARAALNAQARQEKDPCRECVIRPRCAQSCSCLNWQTTGSIGIADPGMCRHERTLIPIADRVAGILYRRQDPLFIQKHYNPAYPVLSLMEDSLGPT